MIGKIDHPQFGRRLWASALFAAVFLSLIILRLWYLQGVRGAYFRDLSENNRIRTVRTIAPRGTVYDREGRIIVQNRPAFNIALMLEDTPNVEKTLAELSQLSGETVENLRLRLKSSRGRRHFEPQIVLPDVPYDVLARIKVNSYRLPGVIVDVSPTRSYPHKNLAAQMLGYVREISKSQLEESDASEYQIGDVIGQAGIEKAWEHELRGTSGFVQVEVDALGNRKGELGIVESAAGNDVYLNLDLDLQKVADEELSGKRGALVALDPNNGQVLAMASGPSFDANAFSGQMSLDDWKSIRGDQDHPLRNRVFGDKYPPGSTFKLILTVAALAEGKITPETTLNCPGYYMFGGRAYHCHKHSGHGLVDLRKALTVSCNAYYYQVGQMLGVNNIHRYASMLGLGELTGIDIPGEIPGLIPSEQWKLKYFGERWYPGETISVAIGQGYVAVTPLQMAVAISTIANGGTVYKPQVIGRVARHGEEHGVDFEPKIARKLPIDPKVFRTVRDLAVSVVQDPAGTGSKARLDGIVVGGKTGTAQVTGLGRGNGNEEHDDHAWFVAFAPAEAPQIAIAVIVENGGHGGVTAAPIAHDVMQTFFRKKGMLAPDVGVLEIPSESTPKDDTELDSDPQTNPVPAPPGDPMQEARHAEMVEPQG